jgi:hypothetical protein
MRKLITGILLLFSIICSGQFDCPDGALISSIPIDSITITDGLLTHYEGTSTDKSRFKRGSKTQSEYCEEKVS